MNEDLTWILASSMLTILLILILFILLFIVYRKSKNKLQEEKEKLESEVAKSQLEIREEFMRKAGKELHDNVGQLLSTAKLQLSMSPYNAQIEDSIGLIGKSLDDIRNLSKVMDPDVVANMGLLDSCKIEMQRLDKLEHMSASCQVAGNPFGLDQKVEIILFRIIQESLNNIIKHARADQVDLQLNFEKGKLIIILKDNGAGFDSKAQTSNLGSGLLNMNERAAIIGADFKIESSVGNGTKTTITYYK